MPKCRPRVLALAARTLQGGWGLGMIFITHEPLGGQQAFLPGVLVLETGQDRLRRGSCERLLEHPQAAITKQLVAACPAPAPAGLSPWQSFHLLRIFCGQFAIGIGVGGRDLDLWPGDRAVNGSALQLAAALPRWLALPLVGLLGEGSPVP